MSASLLASLCGLMAALAWGVSDFLVAISSCYPALTIFLAMRRLHERIPFVPLIGGITGVLGIVILSVG